MYCKDVLHFGGNNDGTHLGKVDPMLLELESFLHSSVKILVTVEIWNALAVPQLDLSEKIDRVIDNES